MGQYFLMNPGCMVFEQKQFGVTTQKVAKNNNFLLRNKNHLYRFFKLCLLYFMKTIPIKPSTIIFCQHISFFYKIFYQFNFIFKVLFSTSHEWDHSHWGFN